MFIDIEMHLLYIKGKKSELNPCDIIIFLFGREKCIYLSKKFRRTTRLFMNNYDTNYFFHYSYTFFF